MRVEKEIEQELKFQTELTDIAGTKFSISEYKFINGGEIIKLAAGYDSFYYEKKYEKTKIIIHNTVGVLRSDIAALTKKDWHVSVPYVIARDGTIYELFNPKMWSYHLGKGAVGGNKTNSSTSIGIELSSYGPLKRVGDNLETMYSEVSYTDSKGKARKTGKDIYCTVHQTEFFTELSEPFRGHKYFAGYTDAQMKSLKILIDYLCETFDIPKRLLDENVRNEVFKSGAEAKAFTGICSHVNFINSGKWDVGPEMDWDYLFTNELVFDEPVEIDTTEESNPPVETPELPVVKKISNKFSVLTFILNIVKRILKK